jgi:hypothetical protein
MDEENKGGNQQDGGNRANGAIAIREDNAPMLSFPSRKQIQEYADFLTNLDEFIGSKMVKGVDYGEIPGVDKPTLLKPGAEKLESLFFLRNEKECVEKSIADDWSFIKYTYRTKIYNKGGQLVSTCEGTCNSHEKKYRFNTVYPDKATEAEKLAGRLETRKSRNGGTYQVYVIEKKDFHDLDNTLMKMAQKRSFVGAILEATNSSGRFTQDVEDMDVGAQNERGGQPAQSRSSVAPQNDPQTPISRGQMNYLYAILGHAKVTKERFEEVILKTYNVKGIENLPKYVASKIIDDLIKKYGEPGKREPKAEDGVPVIQLDEHGDEIPPEVAAGESEVLPNL